MLGSKLPMSMLGKIWDLADQDKDGSLDRWEQGCGLGCSLVDPWIRVHL